MRTFDQLIDDSETFTNRSMAADIEDAPATVQVGIAYALIAIAQELHQINNRADLEEERQELIQARKERLADLG